MSETQAFGLPIKLIAIDVDGTLLNSDHALTERTAEALLAAQAQGVSVMLVTGKTYQSNVAIIEKLKLNTPGIFVGGAQTYNADGTLRDNQTLNTDLVRRAITFAEDRGFHVMLYCGNRLLLRNSNALVQLMLAYGEPQPEVVGPLHNVIDDLAVNKLLIYNDSPQRVKSLRWQLNAQFGEQVKLVQTAVEQVLEMLPLTASKGMALRRLLKSLKITPEQVMAIGDSENDMDMLESVGVSIAMGNASERVKAAAKHTVASNDADGIAEALERFVLAKPVPAAATAAPAVEESAAASGTKENQ